MSSWVLLFSYNIKPRWVKQLPYDLRGEMGKGLKKAQYTSWPYPHCCPGTYIATPPPNCRGAEVCGRIYEAHFLVHWDPLTVWARHWRQELRWEDERIFQPFSLFKWAQCSRHWWQTGTESRKEGRATRPCLTSEHSCSPSSFKSSLLSALKAMLVSCPLPACFYSH